MCTATVTQTSQGGIYFGRTMDFSYPLEPELYVVPKSFQWNNIANTHQVRNHYRPMRIGQDISPVVFADGVNGMGFRAAVPYSPGYTRYGSPDPEDPSRPVVVTLELTGFPLGLNASIEEATLTLRTIRIVGAQDSITGTIAPLHWLVINRIGKSMVTEKTADGLYLMDNPIGTLPDGPDLQWHLANLRNYINPSAFQSQSQVWDSLELILLGQDADSFGLPGDCTPPSGLVRAAFLKAHTSIPADRGETALTRSYIMESISIPKGLVITGWNTPDYTQHTAFINPPSREYFFRTYGNSCITSALLPGNPDMKNGTGSLAVLNQSAAFRRLPESLGTF